MHSNIFYILVGTVILTGSSNVAFCYSKPMALAVFLKFFMQELYLDNNINIGNNLLIMTAISFGHNVPPNKLPYIIIIHSVI